MFVVAGWWSVRTVVVSSIRFVLCTWIRSGRASLCARAVWRRTDSNDETTSTPPNVRYHTHTVAVFFAALFSDPGIGVFPC